MHTLTSSAPILTERAVDVALRRHVEARATGARVRWMREQAVISQAEIAEYVGTSRRTIERVEAGERVLRPAERAAVARALGASIAVLTVNGRGS